LRQRKGQAYITHLLVRPSTISYTGGKDAVFKPDYYEYPRYPQKIEKNPASRKDCHASARFRASNLGGGENGCKCPRAATL
jgi:hypothetical protein